MNKVILTENELMIAASRYAIEQKDFRLSMDHYVQVSLRKVDGEFIAIISKGERK